jgi:hypothetical protein
VVALRVGGLSGRTRGQVTGKIPPNRVYSEIVATA